MQPAGLTIHVFDDDVVDLAQRGAVFQDLPRFVRMEVDLDELLVADGEQSVTFEVVDEIIGDHILVQIVAFDEKLRVVFEFQHAFNPFLNE